MKITRKGFQHHHHHHHSPSSLFLLFTFTMISQIQHMQASWLQWQNFLLAQDPAAESGKFGSYVN
jgi:hypothetical protein